MSNINENQENKELIQKLEEFTSAPTVESLKTGMNWHLRHTLAVSSFSESDRDWYYAFSRALRDHLADQWMKTQDTNASHKVRRAYYLSMEFLIGRLLGNNAINTKLFDCCKEALEGSRLDWGEMQEHERDAGLGNGGLGRLAACFMDSLATMHLPSMGYGLRYDYGLFRQQIINGNQVEEPDSWIHDGYPWEVKRPDRAQTVNFGGEVRQFESDGKVFWKWFPNERITGVPYDIPIVGYNGETVNNLRIWSATACNEFDFQDFNQGAYAHAVESKIHAENLTKTLYPNDNFEQGKELRLRQQYFFVACTIRDIIRRHLSENGNLESLPEKVAIQLNDTHPTLVIPELMRILIDEYGMEWNKAWDITVKCTNYTNHTILPEALEKWSESLFAKLLPRHLQIIFDINSRFLNQVTQLYPGDVEKLRRMSIIEENGDRKIRMANLAIIGSTHVNGVAQIHSTILREYIFKDFSEMFPGKFLNMTNGITQRRWLLLCNRPLASLISEKIGEGWITDLYQLKNLEKFAEDTAFLEKLIDVKKQAKTRLAAYVKKTLDIELDTNSLFDVQVKRLHEYKRQLMLVLYIIIIYQRMKKNPSINYPNRTFIFSAKAAPGYHLAKLIIRLIHGVSNVIANDPEVSKRLQVVFLPDYRVSLAELIIPAADLSEQISQAGMEASGTGCMKLMLNGAMTIGTLDGANVEMDEEVGRENIFIFGLTAKEVVDNRVTYNPWNIYNKDEEIKQAINAIRDNVFSSTEPGIFAPIVQSLLDFGDRYMVLGDIRSFIDAQERVNETYRDRMLWARKSLLNIARSGKFSSDRTIAEYAEQIWHIRPVEQQ